MIFRGGEIQNDDRTALLEGERAGMRYGLAPPRTTTARSAGLHLGRQAGASLEFREHREYQPGDDLRRIDWNAFARSDKLTVKLHREEISPHLDIALDGSRSMGLAGTAKSRAAIGLASAFAVAAANAGHSHRAWLAGARCEPIVNGTRRPATWEAIELDYAGSSAEGLLQAAPSFRRQGMRLLISDLLWMAEPLTILQRLAESACGVIVAHLLAAADLQPPERGRLRLVDSETDEQREIFIDDAAIRRYRDALARHQQAWSQACRQAGAVFIPLVAEELVADWNLEAFVKAELLTV
ncbi:MAG: DUF58 domain-containing protein [Blastocatellia bacterium]|nr:DUF58 domain-containing protein [Blastocatellia bacterium]